VEYRVQLDNYNGPMDLLLYLIKRDELDIYDIPISRITDSYVTYVQMLKEMQRAEGLDINVAGEFLVMAATLMEIKSAMLLPRTTLPAAGGNEPSAADEISDPRYELVQKLLEYKRFKDSAMLLERAQASHSQRFPRYPAMAQEEGAASDEPPPLDMEEVQIWDLLDAFNRLMKEVGIRSKMHEVVYDDTPIDLHAADIEDRLKREAKLTLRQLIAGRTSKSEMIGVFLAMLELVREKRILITQGAENEELEIVAAPEEHRKAYQEGMLSMEKRPAEDAEEEAGEVGGESLFADLGAAPSPAPTSPAAERLAEDEPVARDDAGEASEAPAEGVEQEKAGGG
jgi:segregation and condensation protein A